MKQTHNQTGPRPEKIHALTSVLSFYYLEIPTRTWILRRLDTRSRETIEVASDAQ